MKKGSKLKFTLENCIRTAKNCLKLWFHPTGIYSFAKDVSKNLKLGPIPSQITSGVGLSADILKYSPHIIGASYFVYEYIAR